VIVCSSCRHRIVVDSRFCPHCGTACDADATIPSASSGADDATRAVVSRSSSSGISRVSSGEGVSGDGGAFGAGTVLAGRYRIVGILGRGGMGEAYRADDLTLGQSVALKFLPAEIAQDAERRTQLLAEVRVARQISHANVCRVYDIGELEGRTFLTMEFIDGEDLSSLLRRIGRLPQEKAIEIARQLCAGLAALHDRGVVHRDLKPANIMIDGRGRVRITDFGLAGNAEEFAAHEVRAGTPAYMAPEQLSGTRVDAKSDLYSLG
jgi:serine/threonine-protein kinase